jgi:riboflavin kinase / FMN adenylyltransferase
MSFFYRGARTLERHNRPTLVVIGNFDGVHRGHQTMLRHALNRAKQEQLLPLVLTFSPHPARVLGYREPPQLTTLARKAELLHALDPELHVVAETFDLEFSAQTPEIFAKNLLHDVFGARVVVVGKNFRFGHQRAGDLLTLQQLGEQLQFQAYAHDLVGDDQGPWSSTRVRKALAAGDLQDANMVLGRPHELQGTVIHGQKRGRQLGFPTANLGGVREAFPAHGVYAVRAFRVDDSPHPQWLANGVANMGQRPTVEAGFAVEAHLFDFSGDLYDQQLRLQLITRLREERKFASLEDLQTQIATDSQQARDIFHNLNRSLE